MPVLSSKQTLVALHSHAEERLIALKMNWSCSLYFNGNLKTPLKNYNGPLKQTWHDIIDKNNVQSPGQITYKKSDQHFVDRITSIL